MFNILKKNMINTILDIQCINTYQINNELLLFSNEFFYKQEKVFKMNAYSSPYLKHFIISRNYNTKLTEFLIDPNLNYNIFNSFEQIKDNNITNYKFNGLLKILYKKNFKTHEVTLNNYGFNGLLKKIFLLTQKANPYLGVSTTENNKIIRNGFCVNENINLYHLKNLIFNKFDSNNSNFESKKFIKDDTLNLKVLSLDENIIYKRLNLNLNREKNFLYNNNNWSISSSSNEDEDMINKRLNNELDINTTINTLSISSSSNEDENMINKRLNNELDRNTTINTLFIDSFSNQNNISDIFNLNVKFSDSRDVLNINILDKLHSNLDAFIYTNESSFSNIGGNLDTKEKSIVFNQKKSNIILIRDINTEQYIIKNANISVYKNKPNLYLRNLNIPVYDGSTFFIEDDNASSPNPLINYLQKIKKNHKNDDDALIFCFNILKQYNHINNENLSIYLSLFNTNYKIYDKNMSIVDNIIIQNYKTDKLSKDVIKDIRAFNIYVCQHKYKETNELLNKYNLDNNVINKKVNKDFLKIIFALGWNILDDNNLDTSDLDTSDLDTSDSDNIDVDDYDYDYD
jgi:hypothetical protein